MANYRTSDLAGQRFGALIVLAQVRRNRQGSAVWECLCDCGLKCHRTSRTLLSKSPNACNLCLVTKHGYAGRDESGKQSATYTIYNGMKARCLNPNYPGY